MEGGSRHWRFGPLASDLADDFQSYQDASDQGGQADLLSYEREQFNPVLDLDHIYRSVASPETVFERDKQSLQTGQAEYAVFLYLQKTKRTKLTQAGGSTSGNLGFTYGTQSDGSLPLDTYGSGSCASHGGC